LEKEYYCFKDNNHEWHNHQSKRSPDCPNRTKIVQLNPYRFSFSLTSAALNKQEGKSLGIWEPKQTGKILQLYITKGMTENPINKLTPSRFITTKPVPFIATDDDDNIFFTSQAKQSEQTADAIHPPKQLR